MNGAADTDLGTWIAQATLGGEPEAALLAGLCERLVAIGIPVARASVGVNLLDPVLGGRQLIWRCATGGVDEPFLREGDAVAEEGWTRSPFFHMVSSGAPTLRRRLGDPGASAEFPVLAALQREGMTDYVAFVTRDAGSRDADNVDGMASSWATDAPGGFTDAQVARLAALVPTLGPESSRSGSRRLVSSLGCTTNSRPTRTAASSRPPTSRAQDQDQARPTQQSGTRT